jgi:hypothetical protein
MTCNNFLVTQLEKKFRFCGYGHEILIILGQLKLFFTTTTHLLINVLELWTHRMSESHSKYQSVLELWTHRMTESHNTNNLRQRCRCSLQHFAIF